MSSQGQGYGLESFIIGCVLWVIAMVMFTFPFWIGPVAFALGITVSK